MRGQVTHPGPIGVADTCLDFPLGPAYYILGYDIEFFTPLFVMSRITGWTAHIIEQFENNSLIRPLSAYNGPEERHIER